MEIKELNEALEKSKGALQEELKKKFADQSEAFKKELEEKVNAIKAASPDELEAAKKEMQEQFDELATKMNKQKMDEGAKSVSFDEVLGKTLDENRDTLMNLKDKKSNDASIEFKAEGDINLSNFGTGAYEAVTTDQTRGMYQYPFAPLWLRNILPQGSTSGSTIQYLRENGGTGEAAIWDGSGTIDTLASKPGVGSDFELVTENVEWIAGITRVKREMLDDVTWLQGYLSRQLTVGKRGLYVAENTKIYNALTANSVAYDGDKTVAVEKLYDAAFGQLKDNYYNPTTILMNHRDVVNLIALHKSSGSGEYNLPQGTISVIGNQLILGGVPVIGVPNVPLNSFLVFDRNATEFVNRMNPEVRFFEQDRDNVIKNLITVRAEERIATLIYDNEAIVSGTFETVPEV